MLRKTLIIFILIITYLYSVQGQETIANKPILLNTNTLQEKIVLITDRSIYAVNEKIYFSASYITNLNNLNFDWSTVLYLELIKPDGSPIEQSKFLLTKSGTSGWIRIPDNILTGVYYLKAYTKWMRNFTTNTYGYSSITIINAKKAVVNESQNKTSETNLEGRNIQNVSTIIVNTDKQIYGRREKVLVDIKANLLRTEDFNYCISVVKPELKLLTAIGYSANKRYNTEKDTAQYMPEIDGISISGKISNRNTGKLEAKALVNLALLNNQPFLSGFRTNNNGEFYFTLSPSGSEYELFISAEKNNLDLNILIDEDFCSNQIELPTHDFTISNMNGALVNEMSINAQITNRFENKLQNDIDSSMISFYGTPIKTIYTKKYIDLPYLEEFLFELIPELIVSYKNKEPLIRTKVRHTFWSFPFLVLVDNIPISDLTAFLKIRTNKIERIEIIDNGYVSGNLKYSGIINAFTIKNDMAGVELPKNSMFFKYKMFSPQNDIVEFNITKDSDNTRIPDRRNCLYWNPDFKFSSGSNASFSFFTSDIKGVYEILVYAISKKDGSIQLSEMSFTVE